MKQRALIIENEVGMRQIMKSYLAKIEWDVVALEPSDKVDKYLHESVFDLYIVEWRYKQPPGAEILNFLRQNPETMESPVILVSGQLTVTDIKIAKSDHKVHFLIKPFTEQVFLSTLNKFFKTAASTQKGKHGISVIKGSGVQGPELDIQRGNESKHSLGIEIDEGKRLKGRSIEVEDGKRLKGLGIEVDKGKRLKGLGIEVDKGFGNKGAFEIDEGDEVDHEASPEVEHGFQNPKGLGLQIDKSSQRKGLGSDFDQSLQNPKGLGLQVDKSSQRKGLGSDVDQSMQNPKGLGLQVDKSSQRKGFGSDVDHGPGQDDPGLFVNKKTQTKGQDSQFDEGMQQNHSFGLSIEGEEEGEVNRSFRRSSRGKPKAPIGVKDEPKDIGSEEGDDAIVFPDDLDQVSTPSRAPKKNLPSYQPPFIIEPVAAIKRVLIGDPDPTTCGMFHSYFERIGITDVTATTDGSTFWDFVKNENYDLVVLDWGLKNPSSLAIYNRIRKPEHNRFLRVLVTSGIIRKQDFRIISENHCANSIEKPLQFSTFNHALNELAIKAADFKKIILSTEDKLKEVPMDQESLLALIKSLAGSTQFPVAGLIKVGEVVFTAGNFELSKLIFTLAYKIEKSNPVILTWLGKTLLHLNQSKEALVFLSRAQSLSPQSVERLCLLGEAGLTLKDPVAARNFFNEALKIDNEDGTAQAGMIIAANMGSYQSEEETQGGDVQKSFSSMLNAIGIALARRQKHKAAIEQYTASQCFIYDPKIIGALQFNIGLAYMRMRDYKRAQAFFEKAGENSPKMKEKTFKHLQTIQSLPKDYIERVEILEDVAGDNIESLDYALWD